MATDRLQIIVEGQAGPAVDALREQINTILAGITRDSVLALARDFGLAVEERRVSIDEVFEGAASGRLTEAFGTGTAAVVSPVGALCRGDECVPVGDGRIGKLTQRFYDQLTGIQYGRLPDPHGWIVRL